MTAISQDGQKASQTATYTVKLPSNRFVGRPRLKSFADGRFVVVVRVRHAGRVDILITAWKNNLAHAAKLLNPAPGRFVFARAHAKAKHRGKLTIAVTPTARGRLLVADHRYRVTLRLWVSYTPAHGHQRNVGFYGLHLP